MKYWLMLAESRSWTYERKLEEWDASLSAITDLGVEVGDSVLLWRGGRGGGIVALGTVISTTAVHSSPSLRLRLALQEDGDDPVPKELKAAFEFERLMLATPVSAEVLREAGHDSVVKTARSAGRGSEMAALDLTDDQWRDLLQLADQVQPPEDLPAAWNIPPGAVVKRSALHDVYGGNPTRRVGASGRTLNAFLFVDCNSDGELAPRWEGSVLLTPGQGQWGDSVSLENLSALAHRQRGVPVRVFLARLAECLYLGEFAIDPDRPVERWVVTGNREGPSLGDRKIVWDVRTPILRLRQLSGVPVPTSSTDHFKEAPRISIRVHPVSDRPAAAIHKLLVTLEADPAIAKSLGGLSEAQLLAGLVQRARRQADLDELRAAVDDLTTSETHLQKIIQNMTWIFGGEFIPGTARRNLTSRDQLDLSLLRPDGTLHGVELKRAHIKNLVKVQRNHLIIGPKVNEAVGQAMNYLVELDERRSQILVDFGIDCRRASMTVVIGHSRFVSGVTPTEVDETIRTYNSHWDRVSLTTYDRLIENAQRTLDLTSPER
ncbi:Shedu anti-phage system protein SduA domain-containing protein [Streptomyces sp. FxanaA7]|uniref:Shedu anti-phage system protein SduA domain-containing protein n=1 Tax=Streptomyces sp. FxanaA7 TaxID=1265492 RepID=UPI00099E1096|nr:Shedu anti-phage system protein SduA domain-containing protein [Streptomyces sp. FxanaA7]